MKPGYLLEDDSILMIHSRYFYTMSYEGCGRGNIIILNINLANKVFFSGKNITINSPRRISIDKKRAVSASTSCRLRIHLSKALTSRAEPRRHRRCTWIRAETRSHGLFREPVVRTKDAFRTPLRTRGTSEVPLTPVYHRPGCLARRKHSGRTLVISSAIAIVVRRFLGRRRGLCEHRVVLGETYNMSAVNIAVAHE